MALIPPSPPQHLEDVKTPKVGQLAPGLRKPIMPGDSGFLGELPIKATHHSPAALSTVLGQAEELPVEWQ